MVTGSGEKVPAQQARAALTHQKIVLAARDLFVERGFRAVSLRDIATAAGISHPGLLTHFADKRELLVAVVDLFNLNAERVMSRRVGELSFVPIARRNTEMPGYLGFFASLSSEAAAVTHPAHTLMAERDKFVRIRTVSELQRGVDMGLVHPSRDLPSEAVRLLSAWDGLQLLEQYMPERVNVIAALEKHIEGLKNPVGFFAQPPVIPHKLCPMTPLMPLTQDGMQGYSRGRARRDQIITDAIALFARTGYGDTSMRDIAEAVGLSKSTLFHHFESKEALLAAVLRSRDESIGGTVEGFHASTTAEYMRSLHTVGASHLADQPGLVELYTVLSGEAAPDQHPAHAGFLERFGRSMDHFEVTFRNAQKDGAMSPDRDPVHESIWALALWDGLQYRWLYDNESVDPPAELRAHFTDLAPIIPVIGTVD